MKASRWFARLFVFPLLSALILGCATGKSFTHHVHLHRMEPTPPDEGPVGSVVEKVESTICAGGKSSTIVESLTDPDDLKFVIVVGELFICKLGVEIPIESGAVRISFRLAKRVASDYANLATQGVFANATPATDLWSACEAFRIAYDNTLRAAINGARVAKACNEKAERALERAGGL